MRLGSHNSLDCDTRRRKCLANTRFLFFLFLLFLPDETPDKKRVREGRGCSILNFMHVCVEEECGSVYFLSLTHTLFFLMLILFAIQMLLWERVGEAEREPQFFYFGLERLQYLCNAVFPTVI